MEAPKNKGGRPTKAEQAAKGITESELKPLLRHMKRASVPMLTDLISLVESSELSIKDKIKLRLDLLKIYESLLKTNKMLISSAEDGGLDSKDPDDMPSAPIFRLAG